jgi:hypothetical protein
MALFGQPDLVVLFSRSSATVASSATGMLPMQNYIDTMGPSKISALTVQSDAFGDSWVEHLYAGIRRKEPFTFGGFYDDVAASGPHVIFGQASDVGAERYMEIGYGASDVLNGRIIVESYQVEPIRGSLHRYEVAALPTGAWATTT